MDALLFEGCDDCLDLNAIKSFFIVNESKKKRNASYSEKRQQYKAKKQRTQRRKLRQKLAASQTGTANMCNTNTPAMQQSVAVSRPAGGMNLQLTNKTSTSNKQTSGSSSNQPLTLHIEPPSTQPSTSHMNQQESPLKQNIHGLEMSKMERVGNSSYASHLALELNQLRQESYFCDVTIIVDDTRFPAHKAVLSASSSNYFKRMFTSGFQESTSSEVTIHAEGSAESFKQILEFAYTGYFNLSATNVCDIFRMVCYMDFTQAINVCIDYIKKVIKSVSVEDSFEMYLLAKSRQDLSDLAKKLQIRLVRDSGMVVKLDNFLQVSKEFLEMCLSAEEIEVHLSTEEEILQSVMKWLKYDWSQRKMHTFDILKKIRLGLVPADKLKEILGDEVLAIPECKTLVDEVFKLHATKESATACTVPLIQSHPDMFATRNTVTESLYLFHFPESEDMYGELKWVTKSVSLCYQTKLNGECNETRIAEIPRSLYFPKCSCPDTLFGEIVVGNQVYLAGGGEHQEEDLCVGNHLLRFNPATNEWKELPSMLHATDCPMLVELDGCIYAIGHKDVGIERFHIERQEWEVVPSLPYRLNYSIAAVGFEGYIFVAGPDSDAVQHTYRFLVYNPTHSIWSPVDVHNLPQNFKRFMGFKVHEQVCYCAIFRRKGARNLGKKVYKISFDLKCENPSVRIGQEVSEAYVPTDSSLDLTFDKLKLRLGVTLSYRY
ncbi:kelch-like protein 32 [Amphiura filiformis]|uniref:kelch-like protein 32 n=1 Tax=Amphiura filiformis TaxID=82378 RepID=UPI003B20BB58